MSSSVHPEIASLIREKDLMHLYMEQEDYLNALKKMKRLLSDIRKKDNNDELVSLVKMEITKTSRLGAVSQEKRFRAMKHKYDDWKEQIIQILWDKGYLLESSYGSFFDPSQGKKSGRQFKR